MPIKALVAFGSALIFGALTLTAPALSAATESTRSKISPNQAAAPKHSTARNATALRVETTLTLDDAISHSIKHNPELATFSQEVEARQFEAQQAGFYLNPEFSVEVENFAGSGAYSGTDSAETTFMLSQQFELGGKRNKRQQLGQLSIQLAEQEQQAARARIIAVTTERFVAVLAAQRRLLLADEQEALARKVLETVEQRISAGKTARIEKVRFQALLAEAKLSKAQSLQELAVARRALVALWGQDSVEFTLAEDNLEQLHPVPELEELTSKLPQSPTLNYQQIAAQKAAQSLSLEQAQRIPDLTLSLGAKNFEESNDNALVAGVAIALPIFDRNQGAIGAAQIRQTKARNEAKAAQFNLQTALNSVWQRLQATRSEAIILRDEILPAMQQNFEAITYGYHAGKFGFLEVLNAEQMLFESKNRYIDSLTDYHQTYAELERLLGQKISAETDTATTPSDKQRGQS